MTKSDLKPIPEKLNGAVKKVKQIMLDKNLTDIELAKSVGMEVRVFNDMLTGKELNSSSQFKQAIDLLELDEETYVDYLREITVNRAVDGLLMLRKAKEHYFDLREKGLCSYSEFFEGEKV